MTVSLRDRDKQLLKALAEARYLSGGQLRELFFVGRDESVARKRLKELAAERQGQGALIERIPFATRDEKNGVGAVWALTAAGYIEVEVATGDSVDRPSSVLQPEYFTHHLSFTSLYAGLLAAPVLASRPRLPAGAPRLVRQKALVRNYATTNHPTWRWVVTPDGTQLPWRQYVSGELKERLIKPDAILELPGLKRRLFLEGETGSHTIKARSSDKPGSSMAKAARYEEYATAWCDGSAKRTWYQAQFIDGLKPELVFIVHSEARAAHIQTALGEWAKQRGSAPRLTMRAVTVANLLTELVSALGLTMPHSQHGIASRGRPTSKPFSTEQLKTPRLTSAELFAFEQFFLTAREDLKKRQAVAREQGQPLPAVPKAYEEVKAAVARLQEERQRAAEAAP